MKNRITLSIRFIIVILHTLLLACSPMALTGKKQAPFWMLALTQSPDAGSVGNAGTGNPAGGSFGTPTGSNTGNPVEGMYFFHNDHLNSVSMVTDAKGRMVSGMDVDTGASHVTYMPYGEVNRTNSDGPDIFRYKYTGQEEDQETGLYYYKARYYDPVIGRFIQPDDRIAINHTQGLNPYMYVLGNPINYVDPTGHSAVSAFIDKSGVSKFTLKQVFKLQMITKMSPALFNNPMVAGASLAYGVYSSRKYAKEKRQANKVEKVEMALDIYNYQQAGVTQEEGLKMFSAYYFFGGGRANTKKTWLGHNWTGPSNKSDFPNYNNKYKRGQSIASFWLVSEQLGISAEKRMAFLRVSRHLQPRPRSAADRVGLHHDGEVPGDNGPSTDCTYTRRHIKADLGYIGRTMNGYVSGAAYEQPLDYFIVSTGGSLLFALDLMLFRAAGSLSCL